MLDIECVTVRTVQAAGASSRAVYCFAVRRMASGRERASALRTSQAFRWRRVSSLIETNFKTAFTADTGRRLVHKILA